MVKIPKPALTVWHAQPNPYDGADLLIRTAAGRPDLAVDYDEAKEIFQHYGTDLDVYPIRVYLARYGVFARRPDGRTAFFLSSDGFVYISLGGFRGVIFRQRARSLSSWVGLATGLASSLVALFTAAVPWARWLCGLLALGAAAVLGFLIYQAVYTARIDKGLHVDVSLDEDDNKQDAR